MQISINGKKYEGKEGETILQVARRNDISIPALCYHEAFEPLGACRLCTVEIQDPHKKGASYFVASCHYPIRENLSVLTHSPEVLKLRRTLVDLLLARCPNTPKIQELAEELGISKTNFISREKPDDCILCGRCTKICDELGFHAIGMAHRGKQKHVATPFHQPPSLCVGCLSCYNLCPTGHIKVQKTKTHIRIWDQDFELLTCEVCGQTHITKEYAKALSQKKGIPFDYFKKCDSCHRKEQTELMDQVVLTSQGAIP